MEDSERWRVVGRIEAGQLIICITFFFGVHHCVITRLWKQFQTTQTVFRRPVGGRPMVTTPAEDRYIAIVAKRNRRATSTCVASMVTASIVIDFVLCISMYATLLPNFMSRKAVFVDSFAFYIFVSICFILSMIDRNVPASG
ncbi:UNVERIFIED_CONTAM: hypothetical protein NCL1_34487 [Trichonephila clavipes]